MRKGRGMGRRLRRVMAVLMGACLMVPLTVRAQHYEDSQEPEELNIRDIEKLQIPASEYVGNDVCRLCHEAAYQKWLGTAHSRGFVPLYSEMAMMMGEKMGATADMAIRSGKCLKCHSTAHDVPAAYRGPGFRVGEGVSCEKCHGPGGDHVRAFEDPQSEVDGTLGAPAEDFCRGCHRSKMGHEEIESKLKNFPKAWKKIAHPLEMERPEDELEPVELGIWHVEKADIPLAGYVGSATCGGCHEDAFEVWRRSEHAGSFSVMRSEMGYMMDGGVTIGGPAKNGTCLNCHATGHDAPAAFRASGFQIGEGVGCEKCHGPGGNHVEAMHNDEEVDGMGFTEQPSDKTCKTCHKRKKSHARLGPQKFSFPRDWGSIAHQ